ncbi:hypothetical protein SS05631_c14210 [Sinorhizobium sp. CCBAU 05631]|nr:hypothetical protein SS05631_c14210 [Sinorhizobium sp. CCBAU 05631]
MPAVLESHARNPSRRFAATATGARAPYPSTGQPSAPNVWVTWPRSSR